MAQPIFTLREDRVAAVTPTWRQWYEEHEVDEWAMSVAAVIDQGWNEQYVKSEVHPYYKLSFWPRLL